MQKFICGRCFKTLPLDVLGSVQAPHLSTGLYLDPTFVCKECTATVADEPHQKILKVEGFDKLLKTLMDTGPGTTTMFKV